MTSTLKWFNVGLRAVMELGIFIALGYWGYKTSEGVTMKILLGIATPLIGFGVWSLVDFRNAGVFAESLRLIEELVISGLAALAWFAAGAQSQSMGWALGIVSIVHHVLVYTLGGKLSKR